MDMYVNSKSLDLVEMLRTETFVDLKIFTDEEDCKFLHAHKVILGAASPVLKDLVSQSLADSNSIILPGMKIQILKSVLEFVYCGSVQVNAADVDEFLRTSAHLQLDGLQQQKVKEEAVSEPGTSEGPSLQLPVKMEEGENESEDGTGIKLEPGLSKKPAKPTAASINIPKFSTLPDGRTRCLRCDREFYHLTTARRHFNEKHVSLKETFECSLCLAQFNINRLLTVHLLRKHKITKRMLKASIN